jgi:deazaflavin-dependent oxidoreductase (nitroreductase family)
MASTTTYRPDLRMKVANAVLGTMLRLGAGPGFMWLLTVNGRRSGRPHTTPVVPVRNESGRWLVAPFGEVGWVRNVRAGGQVTLRRGKTTETYTATEVDASAAAPVLRDYVAIGPVWRQVKGHFDVEPGAPLEAFAAEAPRHPVFELHPVGPAGSAGADGSAGATGATGAGEP